MSNEQAPMIDVQSVFVRHYGAKRYCARRFWNVLGTTYECCSHMSRVDMNLDAEITVDIAPLIGPSETATDFGARLQIHPCWISDLRKVRQYANDRYAGSVDALEKAP